MQGSRRTTLNDCGNRLSFPFVGTDPGLRIWIENRRGAMRTFLGMDATLGIVDDCDALAFVLVQFHRSLAKPFLRARSLNSRLLQKYSIHITPLPAFTRFKRLHDGMLGVMEVFGGVLVLGGIAATDVPAGKAFSQVDPGIAHLQTFFAASSAGCHWTNLAYVGTS